MASPDFGAADYVLRWPRALFARELAAVRPGAVASMSWTTRDDDRIEHLLEEAFVGQTPVEDYRQVVARQPGGYANPWADSAPARAVHGFDGGTGRDRWLDRLLEEVPRLREYAEPRPYWPDRHGRGGDRATGRTGVRHRFAVLIEELRRHGWFGREVPESCVDDRDPVDVSSLLQARLGIADLWPLRPEMWDEDTFLGLVEVFHDLAVRPREREYHSYDSCGWHYKRFATETGQAFYRWRVNRLLGQAGIDLQLAEEGEDTGRLVRVVDEARSDLVSQVLQTSDADVRGRVEHAVALFRARAATEHTKRSAVVALVNVLEERRRLLKEALFSDDESALFLIANKFDLRHRNDKQHTDYDPAFRDWVFWWYLGTIELTNRLLARQNRTHSSTAPPPR